VPGQLGDRRRTALLLRRRRLERTGRQHALEPRLPLAEHRRVLGVLMPVEHVRLERETDLGAVGATYALCARTTQRFQIAWFIVDQGVQLCPQVCPHRM